MVVDCNQITGRLQKNGELYSEGKFSF